MNTCLYAIFQLSILFTSSLLSAREPVKIKNTPFGQSSHLVFVENAGQITDQHHQLRKDIDFRLNAKNVNIFIGDGQLHYQFSNHDIEGLKNDRAKKDMFSSNEPRNLNNPKDPGSINVYRLDVALVGANKNAPLITEEKQDYYEQYHQAHTGENGIKANSYKKIIYRDVYPHIDWVLYVNNNELKYDFVVREGGNAKNIKLHYEGATDLYLKDGAVTAVTPFGSITEQKPYCYDAVSKEEISSAYVVTGRELTYKITGHNLPMVIDPSLSWATYFGGTGYDWRPVVTTDAAGNVFMASPTPSVNIATTGAFQTVLQGSSDGILTKFNSSGVLQWATYVGGDSSDAPDGVYCDQAGAVYICGVTRSTTGIATPGSFKSALLGHPDTSSGFLMKFDAGGNKVWGTYYGGNAGGGAQTVTVDNAGDIYLVGNSESTTGIASPGSFQPNRAGNLDLFLAKFNPSGTRLWATYFGGPDHEAATSVAIDAANNIYIHGNTGSTSGISTPGSFQPVHGGHANDNFLVKFNSSGNRIWATYYGGPGVENATWAMSGESIAYDKTGYIYITGSTYSNSGIATPGSHQPVINGVSDNYLAKFDLAGNRMWGTYFGGTGGETIPTVCVSDAGFVYIAGGTTSTTNIATPGAHQTTISSGYDGYIASFNSQGQQLWGTYLGGIYNDEISGIASDAQSNLYVAGSTSSSGLATPGAHQTTPAGQDLYLGKWTEDITAYIQQPFNDTQLCRGQALAISYGVTQAFGPGNVFTVQLSDATGSFTSPVNIGTANATGAGIINCTVPAGTTPGIGYRIRIVSTNPAKTSADNGKNIRISATPVVTAGSNTPVCAGHAINLTANSSITGVSYSWTGPVSFSSNLQNPTRTNATIAMSGTYTVTANNYGCTANTTTNVTVSNGPANLTAASNSVVCAGNNINLTATSAATGATYSWTGPGGYTSPLQNPTRTGATVAMGGVYTVTAQLGSCVNTATTNVVVGTIPATPTAGSNTPVCAGQNINLTASGSTPGVNYSWTGPASYSSTQQNPVRTNATVAMSGTYSVVASSNGCSTTPVSTNVVVNASPVAPVATNNGPLCAGVALNLFVSGQAGATYQWNGPGGYNSTTQNPTIVNAGTANAGNYTVTQTINGCTSPTGSTIAVINNSVSPTINVYPNPNDTVCPGIIVTFVAAQTNGGTAPHYQWYRNGNPVTSTGANTYQTSTYNNSDYYSCRLTSNVSCAVPATVMSNSVTLTVIPPSPAVVNITANPGLVLSPWELVTFTATSAMGGITPAYQWLRNGKPIIGAISHTWSANNLNSNDTISVVLTSSDPCAQPNTDTSNILVVHIKTGISDLNVNNGLTLYPNPNNGDFNIKGNITSNEVLIEVLNAIGQKVYTETQTINNGQLDHNLHISGAAAGIYLLKLSGRNETKTIRFRVQ